MLDMLTFALCIPYSETTESKHFDALLEMVAERGRPLFQLFQVCFELNILVSLEIAAFTQLCFSIAFVLNHRERGWIGHASHS